MSIMTNSKGRRLFAGFAIAAMTSLSLVACGSDNEDAAQETQETLQPVVSLESVTGESTAIKLDTGFTDALESLGLTPGVVGAAKLVDGSLIFPITGGNVTYFEPGSVSPYVVGQIQHEGSGLSLTAGGTTVELTNFNVDPTISRVYGDVIANGKVIARSGYLFRLNGSTLKPLQKEGDNAILEGTKVFISPPAAELLNKTFNTDAVTTDLLVGIAKITVDTTS